LRAGRASLIDGFASIEGGQAYLENVHIPEYTQGTWNNHSTRRRRKLLLNRAEISKLAGKIKESGYTLVPLSLYFKDGYAKVEIALARGKKEYDKRQALKEQQDKREADRAMSTKGKDW
jgi:SsrA-binding protein